MNGLYFRDLSPKINSMVVGPYFRDLSSKITNNVDLYPKITSKVIDVVSCNFFRILFIKILFILENELLLFSTFTSSIIYFYTTKHVRIWKNFIVLQSLKSFEI